MPNPLPPTPPLIELAVYDNATKFLTVTFDQAMSQDLFIDPTRWALKTGTENRYGTIVTWPDAVTLRLVTAQQMGPSVPVEGVYSGEAVFPYVQSLAGVPLADQTFAVVIV